MMKVGMKKSLCFCARWALALGTVIACFLMLEFSVFAPGTTQHILDMGAEIIWLNVLTLGVVFALLLILCNRVWLSCTLLSLLCGALAIGNFFVIKYHSMPLSFLHVRNLQTVLNVAGGYSFNIEPRVAKMLYLTAALVAAGIGLGFLCREKGLHGWRRFLRTGVLVAASAAVIYTGYLSDDPVKPKKTLEWSWEECYGQYGYLPCSFESGYQLFHSVNKPDGYDQRAVDAISIPKSQAEVSAVQPDILLILNETFYDLRQLVELETDIPYLGNIEQMENLLTGYAVVPSAGGGTNSSEYELLTSNSLWLMPGITPFNTLKLDGASSIVSHLSALGYSTLGTHTEPSLNYSRNLAYPALGFDKSYFDKQYKDVEFYAQRWFKTDESVYRNLLRWYEEDMGEDAPRFMYLLTIQNHGGYEMCEPEADLVHAQGDFGNLTDQINEFLTGMYLSDQAFAQLTEYFKQVDRPVLICMLGDHAPSFCASLPQGEHSKEELELLKRKVPLLIWANFDLSHEKDLGTMSMNMVVPTLLQKAGIALSPYYDYLLALKEQTPILTAYGKYYDAQGNLYDYRTDEGGAYEQLVDGYFALEYQNTATNLNRDVYQPY